MDSFSNKRTHSSFSTEAKTASILAKRYLTRDNIKQKILRQKRLEMAAFKNYQKELEKKSARRFSKSPFSVNILADVELQEHRMNLRKHSKQVTSFSKSSKRHKANKNLLDKLRKEVRKIEEDERNIGSKIMAHRTEEKLKKAKVDRVSIRKGGTKEGGASTVMEIDYKEMFWADDD